jgi:thiamine-phosphate pyrophosphorylase
MPASISRSCHSEAELARAAEDEVDFVTLSPLHASPGKGEALGLERFAVLRASQPSLRVLALGGIDATNAEGARRAGADGVAAIRAILAAEVERVGEIARALFG